MIFPSILGFSPILDGRVQGAPVRAQTSHASKHSTTFDIDRFKELAQTPSSRILHSSGRFDDGRITGKSIGVSFEASVLSSFIQTMIDLSAKSAFGPGAAGSSFGMLLAQQVGTMIASSSSIGIAEMVDRSMAERRAAGAANEGVSGARDV